MYEVGMGGRLDATNIVTPEVAVITQIDFDHENFLGHSIEEIAGEKAGIIKPGAWVVSAAERPEARVGDRAAVQRTGRAARRSRCGVEARRRGNVSGGCYRAVATAADSRTKITLEPPLAGRFQIRNALTAGHGRAAARRARIPDQPTTRSSAAFATFAGPAASSGSANARPVYLDGTHNPAGAKELLKFWKENFAGRRIFLVYGAMRDKAVDEIAGLLFPAADSVILTEPLAAARDFRAAARGNDRAPRARIPSIVRDPAEALERAIANGVLRTTRYLRRVRSTSSATCAVIGGGAPHRRLAASSLGPPDRSL